MPLFGRHHDDGRAAAPAASAPGGAAAGLPPGWQPAADLPPPGSDTRDAVHELTQIMYGVPPGTQYESWTGQTTFADVYRASIDGRVVTVANAQTPMDALRFRPWPETPAVAVCTAELPSMLPVTRIRPRHLRGPRLGETPTGNPAFDAAYLVTGIPATKFTGMAGVADALTPDVQQRIMARDDWAFWAEPGLLGCVSKGRFRSAAEVTARVGEVLGIIAAIPAAVLPRHVDHSGDSVLARFAAVDGIEDAIALLRGLTPAEREQLARSDSPLAAFADVRTPQEAIARFQALDEKSRVQLIVMFNHAAG